MKFNPHGVMAAEWKKKLTIKVIMYVEKSVF